MEQNAQNNQGDKFSNTKTSTRKNKLLISNNITLTFRIYEKKKAVKKPPFRQRESYPCKQKSLTPSLK